MNWTYTLTAADRPRLQARIMQILDKQRTRVDSFIAFRLDDRIYIRILADTSPHESIRLKALMLDLEDIQTMRAVSALDTSIHSSAVFHVTCEQGRQNVLLGALAAMGACIVMVSSSHVAFRAAGDDAEIAELCERLQFHWPVERQSTPEVETSPV